MKDIKVVIDSNWGDSGKGHIVDYLASKCGSDGLVIRYNSGAQAGHTVVTPDGIRHVFSHFGSGTLINSPTHLSRFFVCHPYEFSKELQELQDKGVTPKVYVNPNCLVTTPFDVMINQFIEKYREAKGQVVHGSVGVGFNEAIQRSTNTGNYRLIVSDLYNKDRIVSVCRKIITEYVPMRYEELTGVQSVIDPEILEQAIEPFLEYCKTFLANIEPAVNIEDEYEHLIFEGAQGLGLDQDYGMARGYFPHVTHSNTGLKNIVTLIKELGYSNYNMDVIYVTRPYITRHGAGPLSHELSEKPYENIIDLTNVPNEWQGTIRYAWLDINELQDRIFYDWQYAKYLNNAKMHLAITCLDQIPEGEWRYVMDGNVIHSRASINAILDWGLEEPNKIYITNGPSRKDVEVI